MTRGELTNLLIKEAQIYCPTAKQSIARNSHMNDYHGEEVSQNVIDALVVDFVNFVGAGQCLDLGFYTKDLYE